VHHGARPCDQQIKGRNLVNSVVGLGNIDSEPPSYGAPGDLGGSLLNETDP